MPPFGDVAPAHFRPAFDRGFEEQQAEIARITQSAAPPDFENTIAALERSGRLLRRVGAVFFNLTGAHTNPALQEIERDIAPAFARHRNRILMDPALFARIDALWRQRDALPLDGEQRQKASLSAATAIPSWLTLLK